MAEFKIGRLRFTWDGAWVAATPYAIDTVVSHQGKTYVCVGAHTSSPDFNTDLSMTRWVLIVDGKTWTGPWITSHIYNSGNIAIFGGVAYSCITAHTSSNFQSNAANWEIYSEFFNWHTAWVENTKYGINDVVKYGATIYKCIANHTAAATTELGLEENLSDWQIVFQGIEYLGDLQMSYRYKLNDLVKKDASIYLCNAGHNSSSPPVIDPWTLYLPGQLFKLNWVSSTTYELGDVCLHGGDLYIAKIISTNAVPSNSPSSWGLFNQGYSINGEWNGSTLYPVGSVVSRHGAVYESSTDNTNVDPAYIIASTIYDPTGSPTPGTTLVVSSTSGIVPGMIVYGTGFTLGQTVSSITDSITLVLSTSPDGLLTPGQIMSFTGVNTPYWTMLIPGKQWSNRWITNANYVVGDMVVWKNSTYSCIQNHNSLSGGTPGTGNNWVLLIAHDRNNAISTLGDMETFHNNKYEAIPIGTEQYLLRNTSGLPNWSLINKVNSVYYVDVLNGTDRVDYGTTWDQPWKTIKYSCDFIRQGVYFQNSATTLEANKGWLITEMYQWMLYQMANNISPFSSTSLWDPFYAQRDAGYIIDSVIYDMRRGGNSQTVAATLTYFYYGSTNIFVNNLVEASIQYYAPSLNYLTGIMINAATNTPPLVDYQALNGMTGSSYINQTFTTLSADENTSIEISSLMNIVTTALTNETTDLIPSSNTGTTAILYIKTGTYEESLPIIIPENLSVVGDELRSVAIQPATSLTLICTATDADSNQVIVEDTSELTDQMPMQFISPYVNNLPTTFGGVVSGQTYYIDGESITPTGFSIMSSPTINFIGTTTIDSNIISNVSSISNLVIGATITGLGIPGATTVLSFSQEISSISTITMSSVATSSHISSSLVASGMTVSLTNGSGSMTIYAGDCLKDMFYMRNGTTMRNLSMFGLRGTLTVVDDYDLARPTGGSYTSLDPGTGPDDSTVWIFRRSPYVQNVTTFGDGCVGAKIDGSLHNGGTKSIVHNDYTQIISDGIGVWCTGTGAITECVSVFSYYCYIGHFAESGGRIRSTNGNSSYGVFGAVSEGYDTTETPITGTVYNQSIQVQASARSSYSTQAQLVKLEYSNNGTSYNTTTTNLLSYSNNFNTGWTNDTYLTFIKNNIAPTGYSEAWLLTGTQGVSGNGYVYQNIPINPAGGSYSTLSATNIGNTFGSLATFDVTVTPAAYVVTMNQAGKLYVVGDQMVIAGSVFGGITGVNDITITVLTLTVPTWTSGGTATSGVYYNYTDPFTGINHYYLATSGGTFGTVGPMFLSGTATNGTVSLTFSGTGITGGIATISSTGTVPVGSDTNYTVSIHVYAGTSSTVDLQARFNGVTPTVKVSGISYNTSTRIVTPYSLNGGMTPVYFGVEETLATGWYRIWLAANDTSGVNNNLQFRLYPTGLTNPVANKYTIFYGAQVELSNSTYLPSFYLESTDVTKYTAYANYEVVGAGSGAVLLGDEIRSNSIYQARVIVDSNGLLGGSSYVTASNNAQGGNSIKIQLAQTEQGTSNYIGMRIFINSGSGSGQYGYISTFNTAETPGNKIAQVMQESFGSLSVIQTIASGNLLTIANGSNLDKLYRNQAVQFMPTYYTTAVTQSSINSVTITSITGGTENTITVPSTVDMAVNMPVTFSGTPFSTLTTGYTYYISDIIDLTTIQISDKIYGFVWSLTTDTGSMTMNYPSYTGYLKSDTTNMVVNIPIQFSGVALDGLLLGVSYYINDIIDSTTFTLSSTLVSLSSNSTNSGTNTVLVASTAAMVPLNPVVFGGTVFDSNIVSGTKYYISKVVDSGSFNITSSIIVLTATITDESNLITVSSTAGMVLDQPVKFMGLTFGGIVAETVYYIKTINATSFAICTQVGNAAKILAPATGSMTVKTCPTPKVLAGGTGTMTVTSTSTKLVTTSSIGSMNATFSKALLSTISPTTVYYILSISGYNITIGTSPGGSAVTVGDATGNMQLGSSGWDHINPGTPILSALDSTSLYYIEPRITFSDPSFTQTSGSIPTLTGGNLWKSVASGNNYFLAIPTGGSIGARSTDGTTWTSMTLPSAISWTDIAYGNKFWVAISSGGTGNSVVAYSRTDGFVWKQSTLPSVATWSNIVYGNGIFIAIASGTTKAAYSTNYGLTWQAAVLPSGGTWVDLEYGAGIFLAISSNGASAWSFTGTTWQASTLPTTFLLSNVTITGTGGQFACTPTNIAFVVGQTVTISGPYGGTGSIVTPAYSNPTTYYIIATNGSTTFTLSATLNGAAITTTAGTPTGITLTASIPVSYSSVAYGNNRFVAVQNTTGVPASYSFDGVSWNNSNTLVSATKIAYGQGAFVTVSSASASSYISDSGLWWNLNTITNSGYSALTAGFNSSNICVFPALAGASTVKIINAGIKAQGRAVVVSGSMSSITLWEPGSNYITSPSIVITDYNISISASVTIRSGNGVLANPTFISRGLGYTTSSTVVVITGNGNSDTYQIGYTIIVNNLNKLPVVGSNLTFDGNPTIYKVTSAVAVYGTVAPFIEANIQIAPNMTTALSPATGTVVSIRQLYSQCRLTNHDFLSIGVGNKEDSNYPYVSALNEKPQNITIEANQGRVFYTSTDQDGNFSVGDLFSVQQSTGTITLSATQFGLTGLSTLSLGGIAVGGSSVIITQFSTDGTFTANSDTVVPTQRAIKAYITSRLSQGGSNTFTGQLTAGTVIVGGANFIKSSVSNGQPGSSVVMYNSIPGNASQTSVYLKGVGGNNTADGNMAALSFFIRNSVHR